jgi:hypothetical protein
MQRAGGFESSGIMANAIGLGAKGCFSTCASDSLGV